MSSHAPAPAIKEKYIPLFRNLTHAMRTKKLKRNELLVAIFLLEKTLGFGKPKDQLTTGVIAYHTSIRKDRAKEAIQGVLNTGIFDRKPSPRFQYEYSIGQKFLDRHKGHFFAPALPKNREDFHKTEIFSENREHTDIYPFNSLPSHIQQPAPQPEVIDLANPTILNTNHCCSGQREYNLQSNLSPQPVASASQPMMPQTSNTAPIQHNKNSVDWSAALTLPKSISPANHRPLLNIFKRGTEQQAQDTLTVFYDMEHKGLVGNPPFLLKTLALASQENMLIMPDPQAKPMAQKTTIPLVPNALDDSLSRYAEKHGFSAPRQAADFTYFYYRNLLRQERQQRLTQQYNQTDYPAEPNIKTTQSSVVANKNTPNSSANANVTKSITPTKNSPIAETIQASQVGKKISKNHTPDLDILMKTAGF